MRDRGTSSLQVILLSEEEDRLRFALNIARTALAVDQEVAIFLGLKAARWACRDHGRHPELTPILEELIEGGVSVHCCSSCAQEHCDFEVDPGLVMAGVARSGLTTLVQRTTSFSATITI